MSVRNFWLEADIDGRATQLEGGPRSKDGGFSQTIYIRDEGGIERAVDIQGRAKSDGSLVIDVTPLNGTVEPNREGGFTITTRRDAKLWTW